MLATLVSDPDRVVDVIDPLRYLQSFQEVAPLALGAQGCQCHGSLNRDLGDSGNRETGAQGAPELVSGICQISPGNSGTPR
jgi:hypothetical protein